MLSSPTDDQTGVSSELEAHLQRMLQSPHFVRAETLRKLLAYLWEHRDERLSEYAIATEALGRSAHFDSTADASVRVQISRLRRKLKDYYAQESMEPELLQIPMGTHHILVVENAAVQPVRPAEEPESLLRNQSWLRAHLQLLLVVTCLLLAVALGWSLWRYHQLRQQTYNEASANTFWVNFLEGDAPVKIILPTPIFFSFDKASTIRLRSTDVNDFDGRQASPELQKLMGELGTPSLEQSYTVTADTLAAIDMARYLDSVGSGKRVTFDVTRDSSMVVLEQANVVALGTSATLHPLRNYLQSMNFSLAANEPWVDNAKPVGNEAARYAVERVGKERHIDPSILAVLPGQGNGLKLLILESRHTSALVSLVTSKMGTAMVEGMLKAHGNPRFFEMVVDTECEGTHAVRSWPIALHAYTRQAPASAM